MRRSGIPYLFVVGYLLLQAAWIVTVPPFRGSDEFDHVYRAAGVASGQWVLTEAAPDGRGQLVEVSADLLASATAQCAALTYTGHDNCFAARDATPGRVFVATAAGSYNPAYYFVVGIVASPFDGVTALYVMRATSALMCLLLLGGAALAAHRRGSWMRSGVVVSLTPVVAYTSIVVAPNGIEISAAMALWTTLLALGDEGRPPTERWVFWLAVVAASVLSTVRLLGPLFVLMIVISVVCFRGRTLWERARATPSRSIVGTGLVGLATVASVGWMLTGGRPPGAPESERLVETSWGPVDVVVWMLQSIAAFPLRDQPGPTLVYPVVGGLAMAVWVLGMRRATRREAVILCAVLMIALGFPAAITAFTIAAEGNIWQGRYGLPYSVGFVLVAAAVVSSRASHPVSARLLAPATIAWAGVTVACLLRVRSRELARAVSADDPSWWVPWPVVVIGLVAASAVLQAWWIARGRIGESVDRAS